MRIDYKTANIHGIKKISGVACAHEQEHVWMYGSHEKMQMQRNHAVNKLYEHGRVNNVFEQATLSAEEWETAKPYQDPPNIDNKICIFKDIAETSYVLSIKHIRCNNYETDGMIKSFEEHPWAWLNILKILPSVTAYSDKKAAYSTRLVRRVKEET